MIAPALHRFETEGQRFVIDPETCFCFECDAISWDVLDDYPHTPANHIVHRLKDRHAPKEILEVISELEWLRSCGSILPFIKHEDIIKVYDLERGLKRIALICSGASTVTHTPKRWFASSEPSTPPGLPAWWRDALDILFARSESQKDIRFEFCLGDPWPAVDALAEACVCALESARATGKNLTVTITLDPISLSKPSPVFSGHRLAFQLDMQSGAEPKDLLRELASNQHQLAALAKALNMGKNGVSGRVILSPGRVDFVPAVRELYASGFRHIVLDLETALIRRPDLDPQALYQGLHETATFYAQQLLKHKYFRIDPIAHLFLRIYHGTPQRRTDAAGLNEWTIASNGVIYPALHFVDQGAFAAGSLVERRIDNALLQRFEDVGALTTPACIKCWARNLCGGGAASVHQALSGSFRDPSPAWCDLQRAWMERAVAAFNLLSAQGVNFTRMYSQLGQSARPSLFQMVRAAFRMHIGIRPIEESDAEQLTRWENWNDAAYFTFTESGMGMATRYDREMDSLHPRGYEQEFMLIAKNGQSLGLIRIRPDRLPGAAWVWLYFRRPDDYNSDLIRKSFQSLLKELGRQQGVNALLTPAGPADDGLCRFLDAVGFAPAGELRDALYLHGRYHPIRLYRFVLRDM